MQKETMGILGEEIINRLEKENKLLREVVYAASLLLGYFPPQTTKDYFSEPPLGQTSISLPKIDVNNVYCLAKTAQETLIYLETNMANFREFIVKQCFYPDALAARAEDYAKVSLSEILLALEKKYKANFGGLQYDQYNEICYIEIYGEHNCKIRWDLARPFFQQFIGNQTSIAKLLGRQ